MLLLARVIYIPTSLPSWYEPIIKPAVTIVDTLLFGIIVFDGFEGTYLVTKGLQKGIVLQLA
jgi:hypothetical protein